MSFPSPAWVALSLVEHVGAKKLRALADAFDGDLDAVLTADAKALQRVPGIGPKISAAIRAVDLAAVAEAIPRWHDAGITLITLDDPAYPAALRQIADAPPTLFVIGSCRDLRSVAVVGTRSPSRAAADAARQIGYELAQRGIQVISGLALGIDSAAHIGALANPAGQRRRCSAAACSTSTRPTIARSPKRLSRAGRCSARCIRRRSPNPRHWSPATASSADSVRR